MLKVPFGSVGFPRSCGDIPYCSLSQYTFRTFPPFMRGYTHRKCQIGYHCIVSPVHAGIYPGHRLARTLEHCFPRSCGDIPENSRPFRLTHKFPPFMRGYTRIVRAKLGISKVSPVHAGIYLPSFRCSWSRQCFPRSCGDIPQRPGRNTSQHMFPPFMRGYTCPDRARWREILVSPVHAGIYLQRAPGSGRLARFPRSCGDIPEISTGYPDSSEFPPFMRGYTQTGRCCAPAARVSPVHAGIYLTRMKPPSQRESFPRSCGDIPLTPTS